MRRPHLRHLRLASDEWIHIEDFQDTLTLILTLTLTLI